MTFSWWCHKIFNKKKKYFNLSSYKNYGFVKEKDCNKKITKNIHNFKYLYDSQQRLQFQCPSSCRYQTDSENQLKNHIEKYHSSKDGLFECPYCKGTFKKLKNLDIHKVIFCTATNNSLSF